MDQKVFKGGDEVRRLVVHQVVDCFHLLVVPLILLGRPFQEVLLDALHVWLAAELL